MAPRVLVALAASALALVVMAGAAAPVSASSDVIMKPTKTSGPAAALIFIQGASVPVVDYVPLMQQLQATFPNPLWVGIPSYSLNIVNPLNIAGGISRVISEMRQAGMDFNNTAMFYGGHSLGGPMLENYLNKTYDDPALKPVGQVLMGAFIMRNYFNTSWKYPVPTLTIGGELDGLCRVTRIAEGYQHQIDFAPDFTKAVQTYPVVVNLGQSHWQFASGTPPPLVKERDLKPEISDTQARQEIAKSTTAFMLMRMGDNSQFQTLVDMVQATGTFVKPITDAFIEEGSYHIKPPCYSNPRTDKCLYGSPWALKAQKWMGGPKAADITWEVTNSFHPVWKIPFHLPHIFNNCTSATPACKLNITTVAQNVYNSLDSLDTGFYPVTASEVRTKMKSRQAVEVAIGFTNAEFNVTDGGNLCAELNAHSVAYGFANAGARTVARFKSVGEPYQMGPDIGPLNIGPLWIWTPMKYEQTTSNGIDVVNVSSPMLRTPVNYWLQMAAGYHYCKLLSPARSIEWMYVDGLRKHDSLSSN